MTKLTPFLFKMGISSVCKLSRFDLSGQNDAKSLGLDCQS